MRKLLVFWIAVAILVASLGAYDAQLSYDYYQFSCPNVEAIVWRELLPIFSIDISSPAAFLRLIFHDCQVQGCDASILLNSGEESNDCEMISSKNYSIRKRKEIEGIKAAVEAECPGQVSCADIIALAAKISVAISGGPRMEIPLGRRDSLTCSSKQADTHLPPPTITVDGLLTTFTAKGMNLEESVAILGSHTLGVGHCRNIVGRLRNRDEKANMEEGFEAYLRAKCGAESSLNLTFVINDLTPTVFDNQYYMDVLMGRGLFGIDSSISNDPRTAPVVKRFASDNDYFFKVYSSAFLKLSSYNILPKGKGEVRRKCSQVNN